MITRCSYDGVGVDGEAGGDGVVRPYIREGVAGHCAYRDAVHQHVSHMVAGVRRDGEGLVTTVSPPRLHQMARRCCRSAPADAADGEGVDGEVGRDGQYPP